MSGFLGSVGKISGIIGGSFVAFESVNRIIGGFSQVLSMGSHLRELSLATGQNVHDLTILGHAMQLVGGEASDVQKFIFKLQSGLSGLSEDGAATGPVLRGLGIDIKQLRAETALQQIKDLQKGLLTLPDAASRAGVVRSLFGFRFAAKAAPLLSDPAVLAQAEKQAAPLADVMQKNAEAFHALDSAIKGIELNKVEFFGGALEVVAKGSTDVATALAGLNFAEIGREVGQLLNVFVSLSKVLIQLLPLIELVGKLHLGGALAGAAAGFAVGGPWGAAVGGGAGILGEILAEFNKPKSTKWADDFAGLGGVLKNKKGEHSSPVSALQRAGGGYAGGSTFAASDPVLAEAQKQSGILRTIAQNTARGTANTPQSHVEKIQVHSHH